MDGVYDSDDGDDNSDGFSSVIPVSDGYIAVGSTDNGPVILIFGL